MLTEFFFVFFITSVVGLILKCSGYLYKSKCKEVSFCGLKVIRDVVAEEKLDEIDIERNNREINTNQ